MAAIIYSTKNDRRAYHKESEEFSFEAKCGADITGMEIGNLDSPDKDLPSMEPCRICFPENNPNQASLFGE